MTMAEKGKRCSQVFNIAHKLQSREIGNRFALRNVHSQIKFRNFQLQEELDTNEPSEIVQIAIAHSIIFALAESGLCVAFDRDTNKRLCYLNLDPQELIQRLFYNKEDNSVIIGSARASHAFSIKYRTIPLEYIRKAQPNAGFPLFEGEELSRPGFVVFDSLNGKALTFSAQNHIYKVFDLKNYTLLCSISDKEIEKIKITSGIMLLISKRTACGSILPLKILSIEDGTVLKSFHHTLVPNKEVDFVELFHDKILLKQENECLQMVDVLSEKTIELRKLKYKTPSAFIILHDKQLFLTLQSGFIFVWNLQGELVASYRNHLVLLSGHNTSIIQLTRDEELILSYNKVRKSLQTDKTNCSISIIHILTGNCCAKIAGNNADLSTSCRNPPNLSVIQSTFEDAFEDITALSYDEERHEIYAGNTRGFVHVYSN